MKSNNLNILSISPLPSPEEIKSQLPMSLASVDHVVQARRQIMDILDGKDPRLMVIVGPCSIHDHESAIEYAQRLKELSADVNDKLLLIMRVYFEKPRTTVGWKGLIYDPDINGAYNIEKGIFSARSLLLKIVELGLPAATEMLDLVLPQYMADAVSWAAIGARTTESQTHRQLASGLSMPVGFKNSTDGSIDAAIDAISTARSCHSFIGVTEDGRSGVFRTTGNPYGHMVLRGGANGPNYGAEHIAFVKVAMRKRGLAPHIIIDCSHANSSKKYEFQRIAFYDAVDQVLAGETAINGLMLESNLCAGQQQIIPGVAPLPGVSITDACIGWDETRDLILGAYERLKKGSK